MSSGGGGGGGTSTTVQSIPTELKPLASKYTSKAIELSDQPWNAYAGQRYEQLNQPQQAGIASTINRAVSGDPTVDAGRGYLQQQFSGQTNPYLEGVINQSLGDVQGRVMSQFGGSNYGTTANQELLSRSLGDVENNLRMGDYQQQQARAMQALPLALQYGQEGYTDAAQMLQAGQLLQDQGQRERDFTYEQFAEQQNDPYKKLAAMSGVFGSNLGSTSTTQSNQSSGGK